MAKAPETAKLISARELAAHVQKAADIAAKQLGLSSGPAGVIARWELYGRLVKDFAEGQTFAAATKKALDKSVGSVRSGVVMIDKRIIAGFFPSKVVDEIRKL